MIGFPRYVRPHTIVLKHKVEEVDFNSVYEEITIRYVKFDEAYSIKQSQRGIHSADDVLCIIDLNDLYAVKNERRCQYINYQSYQLQDDFFSIVEGDLIIFNNKEYTVTSINEINPFSDKPIFIEVRANA